MKVNPSTFSTELLLAGLPIRGVTKDGVITWGQPPTEEEKQLVYYYYEIHKQPIVLTIDKNVIINDNIDIARVTITSAPDNLVTTLFVNGFENPVNLINGIGYYNYKTANPSCRTKIECPDGKPPFNTVYVYVLDIVACKKYYVS